MNSKKITGIAFALLVLLQFWVPVSMIREKQNILGNGTAFKFRTAPVDPGDYLRGKYVSLDFRESSFDVSGLKQLEGGQEVYVDIASDSAGFAKITAVNIHKENAGKNYIKTTVRYTGFEGMNTTRIYIDWPFDRFYMEESKAPMAEKAYNESRADSNIVSYALVKVKNGEAVIENFFINELPVDEYIKK